ncbi:polysaccharide biosynthesis tyrosine autokinase [Mycolicibacterium sp. GF69]|uniref:polysaccharide biosynthesis tyrosine autokinase n=1 Tax=Mycolicibacterium sp. GF69 TaxID=2267251 RepID=UPI001F0BD903|nr:polysaccharide biosynthesis tyrosine autokinase [Mycolicibacterium sp. GF69]
MTVQDFAQMLRSRWKFICGVILTVVLAAFVYAFIATPQYQATTRLFVATPSDGTNTQTYDGGLFAERRVLSYSELLTGDEVAQRTIDKLGLDMSPAELVGKVEADVPVDTVLIDVTVSDRSATRARDIANTLADEFVVMAAGLETPDLGTEPNARVVVQQRADLPESPVATKGVRTLAIAALVGALLGIVSALIRERFDDSVRKPEVLEEITGVGVLGSIPFDAQRRDNPVVSFRTDPSAFAESFRELRANVRFLEVADGPRVLLVASAMPGEGRTVTAINLSLALTEAGHDVVVVDGDLRRPMIATHLSLAGRSGLSTVLTGAASVQEALQKTPFSRLTALTSGVVAPNPVELLESRATGEVLAQLGAQFDYVIVDSPSMLVTDAALLAANSQGVLLISRFGKTKRAQLAHAVSTLERAGAPLLGGVLTMTPAEKRPKEAGYHLKASDSQQDSQERDRRRRHRSHEK